MNIEEKLKNELKDTKQKICNSMIETYDNFVKNLEATNDSNNDNR